MIHPGVQGDSQCFEHDTIINTCIYRQDESMDSQTFLPYLVFLLETIWRRVDMRKRIGERTQSLRASSIMTSSS